MGKFWKGISMMSFALMLCIGFLFVGSTDNEQKLFAVGENIEVAFNSSGGDTLNSITVVQGSAYVLPTPTMRGYDFGGWYYSGSPVAGSGDSWSIVPEGLAMTLVATWSAHNYSITYVGVEDITGTNPNPSTYNITQNIILQNVNKAGYEFDGWYTSLYETITSITAGSRVGDITVEANWVAIPYEITYNNTFGKENSNPATYTIETDTITLTNISRNGYSFDGWYTTENYAEGTKVTTIVKGSTGAKVFFAKWSIKQITISFEEGLHASITQLFGSTISDLPTPTKDGFTFVGWYKDNLYKQQFTEDTILTSDLTLFAKWSKNVNPAWYWTSGALVLVVCVLGLWVYFVMKNRKNTQCEL